MREVFSRDILSMPVGNWFCTSAVNQLWGT
jgi:hypothetical protein